MRHKSLPSKFATTVLAILFLTGFGILQPYLYAEDYIVIPSSCFSLDRADGGQNDEIAFIFPSIIAGEKPSASGSYTILSFFPNANTFPAKCDFTWSCGSCPTIRITIERSKEQPTTAIFTLDQESLHQLRLRNWTEVQQIQCNFRNCLLSRSGGNFEGLNKKVSILWIEKLLSTARFEVFAKRYLNDPQSFEVTSQTVPRDGLIGENEMGSALALSSRLTHSRDDFSKKVFSLLPPQLQAAVTEICEKDKPTPTKEQLAQFQEELRRSLNDVIKGVPLVDESKQSEGIRNRLPADPTLRTMALNRAALNAAYPMIASPLRMWATPLRPREVLEIAWGTTAIYPFKDGSVTKFYSRMATGGTTRLHVASRRDGMTILPKGAALMSADEQSMDSDRDPLLPFPREWSGLIGTVFVPVYNSLDLHNDHLLVYQSDDSRTKSQPKFLFLLSPQRYIKADPLSIDQDSIAQHTTDARRRNDEGESSVDQFARRFIIVGCSADDEKTVEREFDRLIQAALAASKGENTIHNSGYTMAVFANQTALSIGRHVTVKYRLQTEVRSRLDTWSQVVGESNLSILGKTSTRPLLDVLRTSCSPIGFPVRTLRIHFHTTHPYVLDAVQVGEGDEFMIHP